MRIEQRVQRVGTIDMKGQRNRNGEGKDYSYSVQNKQSRKLVIRAALSEQMMTIHLSTGLMSEYHVRDYA